MAAWMWSKGAPMCMNGFISGGCMFIEAAMAAAAAVAAFICKPMAFMTLRAFIGLFMAPVRPASCCNPCNVIGLNCCCCCCCC